MAKGVIATTESPEVFTEDVYEFTYADGLTFPSVLTPFHWSSLLPMILGGVLLTLWIIYKKTQFYFIEECFQFFCASDPAENEKTKKHKNLPLVPVTTLQPVLMPPKDDMVTIKL
ncbi:hypothetical protein BIW11_11586 [Tropilaelaps mercedesae]|uniref:Uncharacterized protein n=1 Tax=Tropilaelaps mercedesae TaxID=418985 RepID=A0A1V9XAF1_9ACAR|nr:hypothetical protein BIW11_11586 [Tropilaelaps mercedesae]